MGLDLALGGLVLISAIRGWLKGFLVQAIRIVGLVASVYAAVPVRDQARPYVSDYLPSIRPEAVDRLLWWVAAVLSYLVIVGLASLAVAVSRRQTFGIAEPKRGDQFAGLGLGVIKGLIAASFLVAALQKYAEPHLARIAWAQEQVKSSTAWAWNERYHPAAQICAAPPVQRFVNHIQKMGLLAPSAKSTPEPETAVQTASRTPSLNVAANPLPASRTGRPKLVLQKPFAVLHLRTRSHTSTGSSSRPELANVPDLPNSTSSTAGLPEMLQSLLGNRPDGKNSNPSTPALDPELLQSIESLRSQLNSTGPLPGLDDN